MQQKIFNVKIKNAGISFYHKLLAYHISHKFIHKVCDISQEILDESKEDKDVEDDFNPDKEYLELCDILKPSGFEPKTYFQSVLFIDMIASTEIYLVEIVKSVLILYPKKITNTNYEFKEILDLREIENVINHAIDQFVHKLFFKKPDDYLHEICNILSIEKDKIIQYWPFYIEAKARRDLGVHNNWICNEIYLNKIKQFELKNNISIGDTIKPNDIKYCIDVSKNIRKLMEIITEETIRKHSNIPGDKSFKLSNFFASDNSSKSNDHHA